MAKTIIDYAKGRREFLETLYEKKIMGLSRTIDNKDQAIFFASLGCKDPQKFQRDQGGWFRAESIRLASDKALMACPLVGTATTDDEIDQFNAVEVYMSYFEKCAEKGFQIIEEKCREANWDNNLLERRMLKELDLLYTNNVENSI